MNTDELAKTSHAHYHVECNKCGYDFYTWFTDYQMEKPILTYCPCCGHPVLNPNISIDMLDTPTEALVHLRDISPTFV